MWQESAALFPPSIPAAPDDLLVLLSKRVERMLSTRGIELGGMFYTSDELMALRAELAAGNGQTGQLSVRYNPWHLCEIWVLSPVDNGYIKATAIDTAMNGMTEYQRRVLKRAIRERFDDSDHQPPCRGCSSADWARKRPSIDLAICSTKDKMRLESNKVSVNHSISFIS